MDKTTDIQLPESCAVMAEQIAMKMGLSLEEFIALLLRREVCHTQQGREVAE